MFDNRGGGLMSIPILLVVTAIAVVLCLQLQRQTAPSHGINTIGIARAAPGQEAFQP